MTLRYIITGTGRCGTGYASSALTAAGMRCGHESVYQLRAGVRRDEHGYEADSSHTAVGHLQGGGAPSATVIHIVRHPVKVIRSWMLSSVDHEVNRWRGNIIGTPYRYDQRWFQKFWVSWNRLAEDLSRRRSGRHLLYRVDRDPVSVLLDMCGIRAELDPDAISRNAHVTDVWAPWTWDDIDDGPSKREMREMATRYGY